MKAILPKMSIGQVSLKAPLSCHRRLEATASPVHQLPGHPFQYTKLSDGVA